MQKTQFHRLVFASALVTCACSSTGTNGGAAGTSGVGGAVVNGGTGPGAGGSSPTSGGQNLALGGAGSGGSVSGAGGAVSGTGGTAAPNGGANAGGASPGGAASVGGANNTGPATVQLDQVRQLIRGFGINNNWAPIGSDAERLFGEGADALDLNILRIGMGPNGEPYNHANGGTSTWDDINAAHARGAQYIIATLWSPPKECKSNNSLIDGGRLLTSCYESWSNTIAAFPGKVEANTNTKLYAMSPQNEADFASCGRQEPCNGNYDTTVMNGAEAAAFMKIVGPKLRAAGTIPMSPEASEWIHVWSNQSASGSLPSNLGSSDPLKCGFPTGAENCKPGAPFDDGYEYGNALYADKAAWDAFDIMGTHQYDTQVAHPWPSNVPQGTKEVWQTEMSGVKWWPEQGTLTAGSGTNNGGYNVAPTTHIENGVAVARWVHSGLVDGEANAWLYWWYKAIDTDDNEGLLTKSGTTAKRYYTFGNFTRYVKPGYRRVVLSGAVPAKVLLSAYKSDAGKVVVVAINETTMAQSIPITIAGGTAPASMIPYQTTATANWAAQTAVPISGGIFTAALPAMSVTTFVGQ
ncbi:MAG TPA: hypothetical protein VER96_28305 [Polyangiaceae bacterium]|nr:hypothetical protein [Polyangiaceae bacterium]